MASADWIALGAAVAATVACVVAVITYRLQKRTQATSDEKQLNDLIEKIQGGLASSEMLTRGQALAARRLVEQARIKPDWFQNMILAIAFGQAWDLAGAGPYWSSAVEASSGGDSHQAHVTSLEARAGFYYERGLNDDWQLARKDFKTALDELRADPDGNGPDLAANQMAIMLIRQAAFELDAEGETTAVPLVAEAFAVANAIGAQWRKRNALKLIGDLVLALQQTKGFPDLLRKVAAELSRRGEVPDKFPDDTAALLSLPPDGTPFASSDPPAWSHGAES